MSPDRVIRIGNKSQGVKLVPDKSQTPDNVSGVNYNNMMPGSGTLTAPGFGTANVSIYSKGSIT